MVTFGVDAHKRTHTIVAVNDRGTPLGQPRSARPAKIILCCCVGRPGSVLNADGRFRTAVTCLAGSSAIYWRPVSRSCGCRRS